MASPFVSSLVKDYGVHGSKQFGENGAVEFTSQGLAQGETRKVEGYLTGLFARAMRGLSRENVIEYMNNIFNCSDKTSDDISDLVAMIFHTRECRGDGKGERDVFYHLLMDLYKYSPQTTMALLELVPDYGYWKDFQNMIKLTYEQNMDELRSSIYKVWVSQLKSDIESLNVRGDNISLAAKYFPKEGRSLDKKYKVCEQIARIYFDDYQTLKETILKRMRKEVISPLTKEIGIIERMMSNNEWDKIKFNLVPGRCLSINRKAFMNVKKDNSQRSEEETRIQCSKNFSQHMNRAKNGEAVVHGKQMFLHELVNMYMYGGYSMNVKQLSADENLMINAQWNDHRSHYVEMIKNGSGLDRTMVLADFSGSMSGDPIKVAASLAIMISSLLPKPWKNKFISFEAQPQVLEIPDGDLYNKVDYVMKSPWGGNTDFIAAIEMILKVGIDHKLNRDQMPDKLIVVSDMQFDSANHSARWNGYDLLNSWGGNNINNDLNNKTTHDWIKNAFREAGLSICGEPWEAPKMVYWNVRESTGGYPVQCDTPNTQLLSGYSLDLLKLVLDNGDPDNLKKDTPYDTFVKAVRNEKYDPIRKIIDDISEKPYF